MRVKSYNFHSLLPKFIVRFIILWLRSTRLLWLWLWHFFFYLPTAWNSLESSISYTSTVFEHFSRKTSTRKTAVERGNKMTQTNLFSTSTVPLNLLSRNNCGGGSFWFGWFLCLFVCAHDSLSHISSSFVLWAVRGEKSIVRETVNQKFWRKEMWSESLAIPRSSMKKLT